MRSNLLTASRLADARSCPRREHIKYELGYRAIGENANLRFGSLLHVALEAWWKTREKRLFAAYEAIRDAQPKDAFDRIKVEMLMVGYDAQYEHQTLVPAEVNGLPAVEVQFEMPLINPQTGAASRTWRLGGKQDVIAVDVGEPYLKTATVEHKSAASDIRPGTDYWARLCMDSQISIYVDGAEALGHAPNVVIYDVIAKPTIRPFKATPIEERKYTEKASKLRDGTVRPPGSLYANQHEADETPEEYGARLALDIAADPDGYFRRGEVVRLEEELIEARTDLWVTAKRMMEYNAIGYWPRNPDACWSYGSLCSFFGVCSKTQRLDDETLFVKVDSVHPELDL